MKYYIILIVSVLCLGCIGPNLYLIDPTGRQIPTPHYVLFSTSDLNLQSVFYWSKVRIKKDLDGKYISRPRFLDLSKKYIFTRRNTNSIVVTLEISNPKKVSYEIYQIIEVAEVKRGDVKHTRKSIGKSNMPYRQFTIQLPFDKNISIVKCEFRLMRCSDDSEIMRIGGFNYSILK